MRRNRRRLVCDASVVLNLGHRGALKGLCGWLAQGITLVVTPEVQKEVMLDNAEFYCGFLRDHFNLNSEALKRVNEVRLAARPCLLDAGELSVLALCLEHGWEACIDELAGRKVARKLGLRVTGTIGLLRLAFDSGFLTDADCVDALIRLRKGGFHCPPVMKGDNFTSFFARLEKSGI